MLRFWIASSVVLRLATTVVLCVATSVAHANPPGELRELYRGARAQAMGNAFVAIADDEQAIFYNPAGLAANRKVRLQLVNMNAEISRDIITTALSGFSSFGNLSADTINVLMGKDIYSRLQFSPSLLMPRMGLALLSDQQVAFRAKNQSIPQITLGYQFTNGVQLGYGISVVPARSRTKTDIRVGVAGKIMWRRGGYNTLSTLDLFNLSASTLPQLAGNYERGWGGDAGLQIVHAPSERLNIGFGLAYTDIGGMKFGGQAETVQSNLTVGMAVTLKIPRLTTTLAYDYRHILQETDWRKKSHLGLEFSLPLISAYAGLSQTSYTYGASFDAWLFKFSALTYAEELGSYAGIDSERRFMLNATMKLGI